MKKIKKNNESFPSTRMRIFPGKVPAGQPGENKSKFHPNKL